MSRVRPGSNAEAALSDDPFAPPRADLPVRPAAPAPGEATDDLRLLVGLAALRAKELGRPIGPAALLWACTLFPDCVAWLEASGHGVDALAESCEAWTARRPAGATDLTPQALETLRRAGALARPGRCGPAHLLRALAEPRWSLRILALLRRGTRDERVLLWWQGGLVAAPPHRPVRAPGPGQAGLVLVNDDVTSFEFVGQALAAIGLPPHARLRAAVCTHRLGVWQVGAWDPEQTRGYAAKIRELAAAAGLPLEVRVEAGPVGRGGFAEATARR